MHNKKSEKCTINNFGLYLYLKKVQNDLSDKIN